MSDFDSLGARESPYEEFGESSEKDWEGVTLFVNEPVYVYETNESRQLIRQDQSLIDFAKSLPIEELIDSLETLGERELAECLGVEKTNV